MSKGLILIHGYTGNPGIYDQLLPILDREFADIAVYKVSLPGHNIKQNPGFDARSFIGAIAEAVEKYHRENRKIVLIGHSTGGSLLLSFLAEYKFMPQGVVLMSTPHRITGEYLTRWEHHYKGNKLPLNDIARLVSLVNNAGRIKPADHFPVLILHGEEDMLVHAAEAFAWTNGVFPQRPRIAIVPGAGHALIVGEGSDIALGVIRGFLTDVFSVQTGSDQAALAALSELEPQIKRFLEATPLSSRHLAKAPGASRLLTQELNLDAFTDIEPVFANIEITTLCSLSCRYCAKSWLPVRGEDMPWETFRVILGLLPHSYRLTLVGLGEPLLHPRVTDMVREAALQQQRVALVTNGLNLDKELSRELIGAGLSSITFSLDAANQELASRLRPGSDLARIVENIRGFIECLDSAPLATSVFTAVSKESVSSLRELAGLVAGLGVQAWMLTDINFSENQEHSLRSLPFDEHLSFSIKEALSHAFSKKLPVLSVRGLEEFGLDKRTRDYLLLPPRKLWECSPSHCHCLSPWQTIAVGVRGEVSICDCQPEISLGNILNETLSRIWNGELMQNHRRSMRTGFPPGACVVCPRF